MAARDIPIVGQQSDTAGDVSTREQLQLAMVLATITANATIGQSQALTRDQGKHD